MIHISLIYLIIVFVLVGIYIYTIRYEKSFIHNCSKKEHPLLFLYSLCLFSYDKFNIGKRIISPRTKEALDSLNYGRDKEKYLKLYWCKKCSLIIVLLALFTVSSLFYNIKALSQGELIHGDSIKRPDYGEGEKEINLNVVVEADNKYIEKEIDIKIEERRYDTEGIFMKLEEAKVYIDNHILDKNESLDNIRYPLNLAKRIPGTSITVQWELDNLNLVEANGVINNEEVSDEGQLVEITARVKYYETIEEYPIAFRVYPKIITKEEQTLKELRKVIAEKAKETQTSEKQALPNQLNGKAIYYSEQKERSSEKVFLTGFLIAGMIYFFMDKEILKSYKKRETEILIDYPEIINKFVLLLGAGMTMKSAWEKIAKEYLKKREDGVKKKRYAYEEMLITYHELSNGVIETKAYESFGRRMKVLPYLRFSSLIAQNLKKGSRGLLELLEYEAVDAFNERKELAKRLGEEASTKLLMPMMLMLLIVLAIIIIPAFMGL